MTKANGVSTPMFNTCKLCKHGDDNLLDLFLYISTMDTLQCVTLTRSDIVFCVNKACQYMYDPLESHWSIVKRVLR